MLFRSETETKKTDRPVLAKTRRPSWTSRLANRSRTSWSGQGAFLYSPKRAGLPGHPGQPTVPGHPGRAEKPKQKKTDHPLLAKTSRPSRTSRLANRSRTSWSGQGAFLYSPKRAGLPGNPGQPAIPGHPGLVEVVARRERGRSIIDHSTRREFRYALFVAVCLLRPPSIGVPQSVRLSP